MSANGFRGRVSQVRILPGPLLLSDLFRTVKAGFLRGKPSLKSLISSPARRAATAPGSSWRSVRQLGTVHRCSIVRP